MNDFDYHRPRDLPEAARLAATVAGSKLLAGGMSLLPVMKLRLAQHAALIDLCDIESLKGISETAAGLRIGAMTAHAAVAASELVMQRIPALARLAGGIGDPLVRNRGTLGGSLANNDPAACYPSALLALNATVITDRRRIAADDFILGTFETALAPGELITAVEFPRPDAAAYMKFANYSSRFSIVGVFVARSGGEVRVAVTGAGDHAFRASALEAALSREFSPAAIRDIRLPPGRMLSDMHGSAEYRAELITVLAQRGVEECLAGSRGLAGKPISI